MRGDFTRLTYDATKHYVAVRAQQGRVSVDADINELQDIVDHLHTTAVGDVIGPVGAPAEGGLGIAVTGGGTGVAVTQGRLYVDGVLVEVDDDTSLADQPYLPDDAPVVRRGDGTWVGLDDAPAGRYLAYIDAWRHHLTALDDPHIREVALGGPDTATREQLRWRVGLLRVADAGDTFDCAEPHAAWTELTAAPTGVLAARAEPDAASTGPCIVPADAGFRRIDNQLYRVEIHDGGTTGAATWKASRDNGAVERRLVGVVGDDLIVSRPGRDAADGFTPGSWAELTDDSHEQASLPGTMVRVVRADGNAIRIDPLTKTGSLTPADFPDNPRVRRWDTDGPQTVEVAAANDGYLELEDGVQVLFSASATWRTGDYWMIPARVATGDVEWPQNGAGPAAVAPHGTRHHFARLALLTCEAAGSWTLDDDCIDGFPSLTTLRTLEHVSGDGQEAVPNPAAPALISLGQPLVAGVAAGSLPVSGARVQFEVTAGDGTLDGTAAATPVEVLTDASGLASVAWSVDPTTTSQQVTARLLAPDDTPEHLPVVFGAELSTALYTAYDPAACPDLAGAVTVQEAIDRLCGLSHGGCASVTVSPGEGWQDVLTELPAGEDAVVCFRPGEYVTEQVVELAGLRHLVIHGGGAATVIRGMGLERVLAIRDAASVHIADLDVRAGAVGATKEGYEHVNGAVTIENTPVVTVERLRAHSVAGVRRQASCLTVRGSSGSPSRVRVRDCDLTVGHRQVGVLLVDCDTAHVTGNRISVAQKPGALSFNALLTDATIRARVVDRLVSGVGEYAAPPPDANTAVDVGGWQLAFRSPVPEREWRALIRENPPTDADRRSAEAITAYADRLVGDAVSRPDSLASYEVAVRGVEDSLGALAEPERETVLRRMLVADEITATPAAAGGDVVALDVGGAPVTFHSELNTATWSAALAAEPAVSEAEDPTRAIRDVAERLVTDAPFRARVSGAAAWFARLASDNPAVASQGIVVGGRVARAVEVADNVIDDAVVGIHLGVSHASSAGAAPDQAGRVRVVDNVVTLRLPIERKRGQFGIFLGNVEHGLIAGNDVRVAARAIDAELYDEGIRVWGYLGSFLGVRENVVANAAVGIRVVPENRVDGARQWFVVDNATPHAAQSVQAPTVVRRRDNIS